MVGSEAFPCQHGRDRIKTSRYGREKPGQSCLVSQRPGSETVLPLNSITALIVTPVVMWVILHRRSSFF